MKHAEWRRLGGADEGRVELASEAVEQERRVPHLAPGRDPMQAAGTPEEGFLLSRIDGRTPWGLLRQIGGLDPDQVEACLRRWLADGVVVLPELEGEGAESAPEAAAPPPEADAPSTDAGFEALVDPDLDLAVELQREILEFERSLDRPYTELLGVAPDAEAREIKRAYFALSKRYHPDRYYRREIGAFADRLARIFKKLVEAYELLSDPATRAEVQRSMSQAPPAPESPTPPPAEEALEEAPEAAAAPSVPPTKEERRRRALERLRRQLRIPEEILVERRIKARELFQTARVAIRRESWNEAAAGIRLAIAFDPWTDEYKESFAEVQGRVHQLRAAELLERANASLDGSAQVEALRLYEEALHYRPGDPEVNHRAAQLADELNDLEKAREYAESACELDPESTEYLCTLGRVLRRSGLRDKAKAAYDAALKLDRRCETAKAELRALKRPNRRR